jgi:hypothetical protein
VLLTARDAALAYFTRAMARNLEAAFLAMWEGPNGPPKHINLAANAAR